MKPEETPIEDAEAFWNSYNIPFEHDTAIKQVRSGLLRGSSGNGRNSNSVTHLHVQEQFLEGRLGRMPDTYLCERDSNVTSNESEERHVWDGDYYKPEVTCQACLNLMERWEVVGDDS